MSDGERRPLLQDVDNAVSPTPPPPAYAPTVSTTVTDNELPPPYTPSSQGGIPVINCKVCQSVINIEGRTHQHVVKCDVCKEATPIRPAPPGKKYVRCPCNCLLICKSTSQRIACPRPNCRRIINLSPVDVAVQMRPPGTSRIRCAHCQDTFLFNILTRALARCPHCEKVSSVGPSYVRSRATFFTLLGIMFVGVGIGVTVGTHKSANGWYYLLYIVLFVVGALCLIRALFYGIMKISRVEGPA